MIYEKYEKMVEDFENDVECPSRLEIEKEVFVGFDKFVGTKEEISDEEKRLTDLVATTYISKAREYDKQLNEIEEQFKEALFEEYGFGVDTINSKIWGFVSGSSCYYDIEDKFEDLIEIAEFAYRAGQMID
jgi:hypothetical protein